MRLKKVRIVVESLDKTSERWAKALQGKYARLSNEEVVTVSSWEILGKILSPPRLQILMAVAALKPKSISALAKAVERDFKNVYSDVMFLADLGLIELKSTGARKTVMPVARYSGIELGWAA